MEDGAGSGARGMSGLTRSSAFHRVPTAPSTELPRLMAPQVASASAKVSWVAGRGRNRLGALLRGYTSASRRKSCLSPSRQVDIRAAWRDAFGPSDVAACAAQTRRASRYRRSRLQRNRPESRGRSRPRRSPQCLSEGQRVRALPRPAGDARARLHLPSLRPVPRTARGSDDIPSGLGRRRIRSGTTKRL